MTENTAGPTSRVLAVFQRYSTAKFCKSFEVKIIYTVVFFAALLNKKEEKAMHAYLKTQARLQQPNLSLLPYHIKGL